MRVSGKCLYKCMYVSSYVATYQMQPKTLGVSGILDNVIYIYI